MIQERKCSVCKKTLKITDFYKTKNETLGYSYTCKSCDKEKHKRYNQTKKGIIRMIFNNQRHNCIHRSMSQPTYDRTELYNWAVKNNVFNNLFKDWVGSNYKRTLKPSIDRIDDYKSYTFDNIRILTWGQHIKKTGKDIVDGKNRKQNIIVIQLSLTGDIICEHQSQRGASRKTGVLSSDISKCCRNKQKTAGGFKWKLK